MEMQKSDKNPVMPELRKGSMHFNHWINRFQFRRWPSIIMLVAMTLYIATADIQEARGDVINSVVSVLTGESVSVNCMNLDDWFNQHPLDLPKDNDSIITIGIALDICALRGLLSNSSASSLGLSLQSANMRYPAYIVGNQGGTRLYTANFDSTVSTIDVLAEAPIGTIQFPSHLDGGDTDYTLGDIAINPMGSRLYVLNTVYKTTLPTYTLLGNTVEVIDAEKNAVVASVPLGLESQPNDVVVDATGSRVYVTTSDIKIHDTGQTEFLYSGKVNVIDAVTNTVLKTIAFSGQAPSPLVAHPDGSRIYVGVPRYSFFSDDAQAFVNVPARVSVIGTAQNTVTKTIDLEGGSPRLLAINPTGTRLYVAYSTDESFLEVIDTTSSQVIARVDIPVDFPFIGGIQVTADGAYLYMTVDVSTGDPDLIYIIDTTTNTIVSTIELPPDTQPGQMASLITVNGGQVPLSNISSASFILQTPVIQVPGFGEYNASFVLSDPANLELTLTDVSGTDFQTESPALFSLDTGELTLPVLAIDGKAFFQVDLVLVPDPSSLRFRVTQVEPLP
jgi:DNA-binding beta-propeller fold protein YncE